MNGLDRKFLKTNRAGETARSKLFREAENHPRNQPEMDAPEPVEKRGGPPKFKARTTRTFKSKAPKPGQKGFGDDIPGMEGLGTDITVVCPWEAFGDMELSDLAKYGIL
ncbi:hypothetical protein DNTS_011637 [Danionella cerebrum]|uniref:3',5'-cyclic-GMP phosphodiesterase n=1 Tax=Danionella cerebrum TaxID=2873325 RepID=A0A553NMP7_9TELE|nr:hypothetical protein DNTS_011637 [Danionella translucida]